MFTVNDPKKIIDMFSWCRDSMLKSYSEGITGAGYCDNKSEPAWSAVFTGDYCFLAGKPAENNELAQLIKNNGSETVVIPQYSDWLEPLNRCGCGLELTKRYHTRLPDNGFDLKRLEIIRSEICKIKGAAIEKIGEKEYNELRYCKWENSFVSNFKDYSDYSRNGFGYIILIDGQIASGASTFGSYSKGVEIQIASDPKYRRMGLASICSAQFIIECIKRGLRPHWDAANLISVKIAEKLGFKYDGSYPAFYINKKTKGRSDG